MNNKDINNTKVNIKEVNPSQETELGKAVNARVEKVNKDKLLKTPAEKAIYFIEDFLRNGTLKDKVAQEIVDDYNDRNNEEGDLDDWKKKELPKLISRLETEGENSLVHKELFRGIKQVLGYTDKHKEDYYQQILKAYDDYQSSIRHEGNPGNRLYLWKELCEEWEMTSDEFSGELKKAQKWEKENKDTERQKRDVKWFADKLKAWENDKLNDKDKGEVVQYLLDKEIDWDEVKDEAKDNLSPLDDILADSTKLERKMYSFDKFEYERELEEAIEEELEKNANEEDEKVKKDWDNGADRVSLIKDLKFALVSSLAHDLADEIQELLNDTGYGN